MYKISENEFNAVLTTIQLLHCAVYEPAENGELFKTDIVEICDKMLYHLASFSLDMSDVLNHKKVSKQKKITMLLHFIEATGEMLRVFTRTVSDRNFINLGVSLDDVQSDHITKIRKTDLGDLVVGADGILKYTPPKKLKED